MSDLYQGSGGGWSNFVSSTGAGHGNGLSTALCFTKGTHGLLLLCYGSLVTPLFEELLFRGHLFNLQERIHAEPYQVVLLNALLFSVWHIGYILGGVDGALRGTVICKNCKVGVFPNEMGRLTRSLCFQKESGVPFKRSRFQKGTGPFGWRLLGGRS